MWRKVCIKEAIGEERKIIMNQINCSNCPNKKWFEGLYCIADHDWVLEPKYICKKTRDGIEL